MDLQEGCNCHFKNWKKLEENTEPSSADVAAKRKRSESVMGAIAQGTREVVQEKSGHSVSPRPILSSDLIGYSLRFE